MLPKRIDHIMKLAMRVAEKSDVTNRHGCIIARGRKIVAFGWNKDKTHPAAQKYHSQCIHAELAAILAANASDLKGADLYVCRLMRDNNVMGLSRPCPRCLQLIQASKIRRILYSNFDGSLTIERV